MQTFGRPKAVVAIGIAGGRTGGQTAAQKARVALHCNCPAGLLFSTDCVHGGTVGRA